jgi:hypothetical protein
MSHNTQSTCFKECVCCVVLCSAVRHPAQYMHQEAQQSLLLQHKEHRYCVGHGVRRYEGGQGNRSALSNTGGPPNCQQQSKLAHIETPTGISSLWSKVPEYLQSHTCFAMFCPLALFCSLCWHTSDTTFDDGDFALVVTWKAGRPRQNCSKCIK